MLLNDTEAGNRNGAGVFGAFRAGPVTLLGEVDYIDDDSIGVDGRKLMASIAEADWKLRARKRCRPRAGSRTAGTCGRP